MSSRDILFDMLEDIIKLKPQLIPFKQMIKLQIYNLDEEDIKEILIKLAKVLKKNGIE